MMKKLLSALLAMASMAFVLSVFPLTALADNTSSTSPQNVAEGETVTLAHAGGYSANNLDYFYTFTMPEDGYCYFTMTRSDEGAGTFALRWTNELGEISSSQIISAGRGMEVREVLVLTAGEYMFAAGNDNLSPTTVQFSWTTGDTVPGTVPSTIDNTSMFSPRTVAMNEIITLAYPSGGGVRTNRYFKFTMPADGNAIFTMKRMDRGGGTLELNWTDELGKIGGSFISVAHGQEVRESVALSAGEYLFLSNYGNLGVSGAQFSWTTDAAPAAPPATAPAAGIPKIGTYANDEYDSTVTINADNTFSMNINFGERIIAIPGTWETWQMDGGETVITFNVQKDITHTGWSVSDAYYLEVSPANSNNLYIPNGTGNIGLLPVESLFAYTGAAAPSTPVSSNAGGFSADGVNVGANLSWDRAAGGLGWRVYRSETSGEAGISISDFYIMSNNFVDVNVKPSTTYYYTLRQVLAEADPFNDRPEQLGPPSAQVAVTTPGSILGDSLLKPNAAAQKKFITMYIDNPIMTVNGGEKEIDPGRGTAPTLINNRTMVPISAIVESMGGSVGWNAAAREVTINYSQNTVRMVIDRGDFTVNGQPKTADVPPMLRNSRTLIPVGIAAESLGCAIDYINSKRQVVIVYY